MEQADILIVDDNPEIREIIQILLTGEGFRVTEAEDGEQALQTLEKAGFDLIILDIMMPGMDGYHTCLEMRKMSNAPILFLSAKTKDSDKTLGFSSGGDDYLAKPFSYSELISRLKECEKNDRRNWCSHDRERGHSIFYGGNRVFGERIKHIPDCISSGMC